MSEIRLILVTMLTSHEIRILLRKACEEAGGVPQWAAQNGLSHSTVYDALAGLSPQPKLLEKLGCKRVVLYQFDDQSPGEKP